MQLVQEKKVQYFKPVSGLPTPSDTGIGERATTLANEAVQQVLDDRQAASVGSRKRKAYPTFASKQRAQIGKYASEHGNKASVKRFEKEVSGLGESTVRNFKQKYLEALKASPNTEVKIIPSQKCGRPLSLGELDTEVQQFIRAMRKTGTPVNSTTIIAAAKGIVAAKDRTMLVENRGYIKLSKPWAASLMERMKFSKRRGLTKASVLTEAEFQDAQQKYLRELTREIHSNKVPPQLVLNWDQTGLNVVPTSSWTMEEKGSRRVEIVGLNDKRQITATFAVNMCGEVLLMQLLYQGKTERCHLGNKSNSDSLD